MFVNPIKEMECCKTNEEFRKNFRDTDHLSNYGSDVLINKIIQKINN